MFAALEVYRDIGSRSATLNMAIDEALLETANHPAIRFYRWNRPAISFGYFGKFADVENYSSQHDIVRRWTGGGIVFHGEDLTYSIVIPASDPAFGESPMSIYEKVHRTICETFSASGQTVAALYERRPEINSEVIDRRYKRDACFANPVKADVMVDGKKIAGAAQRRTRRGLLQQGSIQDVDLPEGFEISFASQLSDNYGHKTLDDRILTRAREIADRKYATSAWIRRR